MTPSCPLDKVRLSTEVFHLSVPQGSLQISLWVTLFSSVSQECTLSRILPLLGPPQTVLTTSGSLASLSNWSQRHHLCCLPSLLPITLSSDVMAEGKASVLSSLR